MSCIDNYNNDYHSDAPAREISNKNHLRISRIETQNKWFDKKGNFKSKYVEK